MWLPSELLIFILQMSLYLFVLFLLSACRLSGLVQQFCGVSHCLIHSLLSGRPVVLAAADQYRSLVMLYVRALSTLLPRSPRQKLPMLRYQHFVFDGTGQTQHVFGKYTTFLKIAQVLVNTSIVLVLLRTAFHIFHDSVQQRHPKIHLIPLFHN